MTDIQGKTAFITGAASGIGLALTKAMIQAGAKVMMADIDEKGQEVEANLLRADGAEVATVVCDVRDPGSVNAAAKATIESFGKVHIVANNAGVSLAGKTGEVDLQDWRWIVDINLMGVVHGVEVFTPLIRSHGEGGHIINTASMAGHATMSNLGPYNATKFAVVGYSEALAQELPEDNIHVSILCPTWVQSNIHNTGELRPSGNFNENHRNSPMFQTIKALVENGMPAETYAAMVLNAVQNNRLYVFNDPTVQSAIDDRRNNIMADYDACLEFAKTLPV